MLRLIQAMRPIAASTHILAAPLAFSLPTFAQAKPARREMQKRTCRRGNGVGENYGGTAGACGKRNTGIGIITNGEGGAAGSSH